MSEEDKEASDPPPDAPPRQPTKGSLVGPVVALDPEVVEWDHEERFHRYAEEIGRGKFKVVYRGYDTENGIDVAWCKVHDPSDVHSAGDTLPAIHKEIRKGLTLDHPNIIRCFACWMDIQQKCINLITELFTSGNLRSYRMMYSNVNLNVHRKYIRQILNGLIYLHAQSPPIIHADLRLDKIYVNGFNGEVKIGDLGLTTLLSRGYRQIRKPEFDSPLEDVLALGLCAYELLTGAQLDREHLADSVREVARLQKIRDSDARDFILQCITAENGHLTATELLSHPFLNFQVTEFKVTHGGEWDAGRMESQNSYSRSTKLKGEDFTFEFQGYKSDDDESILHVQLILSSEADEEHRKILDFDYNLEADTPDSVGRDIAESVRLSSTDRDLCIAALKEWLTTDRDTTP